jgi:hypothetical protein
VAEEWRRRQPDRRGDDALRVAAGLRDSGGAGAGGGVRVSAAYIAAARGPAVGWQAGPAGWALLGWAGPFLGIWLYFLWALN